MKLKAAITVMEIACLSWLIYRYGWPAVYPIAAMIAAQITRLSIDLAHVEPAPLWDNVVGPEL